MSKDTIFVEGAFVSRNQNAPDFIKCKVSYKVDDFIKFLNKHKNAAGYVNTDIKVSKEGKWYAQVDTWEPKSNESDFPF